MRYLWIGIIVFLSVLFFKIYSSEESSTTDQSQSHRADEDSGADFPVSDSANPASRAESVDIRSGEDAAATGTLNPEQGQFSEVQNVGPDLDPDSPPISPNAAIRNVGEDIDPERPPVWQEKAVRNVGENLNPSESPRWTEAEVQNVGNPSLAPDAVTTSHFESTPDQPVSNHGDPTQSPES